MATRLASGTSPYLRQHADNPVDWFPWSDEAFELAEKRDLPVFISIGYAACHWCHVMAHESFEDREVAAVLNESFINIKVDREEHPTVDHFYMTACTAMGQRGGWPLTVIAFPNRIPVYCATYLPKRSVHGRIGLIDLAERFSEVWKSDRHQMESFGTDLVSALEQQVVSESEPVLSVPSAKKTVETLGAQFDLEWGGFGDAPKFPTAHQLSFLLRANHAGDLSEPYEMVDKTIRSIRSGGVFDQVGLGVHRYSTDREWKLPHFEKMLVDQAMLAIACVEAYQVSKDDHHKSTAEDIIEYVLRDLLSPEGAFYSSEDADSEGEEGIFYLWSWAELSAVLNTEELEYAQSEWTIAKHGNVDDEASGEPTGLNLFFGGDPYPSEERANLWDSIRAKLSDVRSKRIRPTRDEKILTDWNGAMIAALAIAGRTCDDYGWIERAEAAAVFVEQNHLSDRGLVHSSFEGVVSELGSLDDHAFYIWGLLELFSSTGKTKWLQRCRELSATMIELFWVEDSAGFFLTKHGAHRLPVRQKQFHDGATPAGASIAAMVLLKLSVLFGDDQFEEIGRKQVEVGLSAASGFVLGFSSLFSAAELVREPRREMVIVSGEERGESRSELQNRINEEFLPNSIIIPVKDAALTTMLPHLDGYQPIEGKETVYICTDRTCEAPITELGDLEVALKN